MLIEAKSFNKKFELSPAGTTKPLNVQRLLFLGFCIY